MKNMDGEIQDDELKNLFANIKNKNNKYNIICLRYKVFILSLGKVRINDIVLWPNT